LNDFGLINNTDPEEIETSELLNGDFCDFGLINNTDPEEVETSVNRIFIPSNQRTILLNDYIYYD